MLTDSLGTLPAYAYMSPKLELRETADKGEGLFATTALAQDEVVAVWGGVIVTGDQLFQLPAKYQERTIQVEEDLFQVSVRTNEPADAINHSCDPNLGFRGQIVLVAMRDIPAGEEITVDYAMCDATPFNDFPCTCGTERCRSYFTANDWRIPELWARYDGYFSPYLQRRIDRLRVTEVEQSAVTSPHAADRPLHRGRLQQSPLPVAQSETMSHRQPDR